jgi:5-bromo-4-chloroindolyl phosphate hydrolysis protein
MARPRARPQRPVANLGRFDTRTPERGFGFLSSAIMACGMGLVSLPLISTGLGSSFHAPEFLAGLGFMAFFGWVSYALGKKRGTQSNLVFATSPDQVMPNHEPLGDAVDTLMTEARRDLGAMSDLLADLPVALRLPVKHLLSDGHAIVAAVKEDPDRLAPVLRFFTYYLPSTLELLKDRTTLSSVAGQERIKEIDLMVGRLVAAFDGFRTATIEPELASIDLEMGLLDSALSADFDETKTR